MGIKGTFEKNYFDFYRWTRKVSAQRKRIREFKNKPNITPLTPEQSAQVKAFYSDYKMPDTVFHSYFTTRSGKFFAEYIPQDLYVGYIIPYFNDIVAAKYYDNKCLYDSLFHGIPQCECILKRVNSIWLDGSNRPVSHAEMAEIISATAGGFFLKEAQSTSGGAGVTHIPQADASADLILDISKKFKTDIVVQKALVQHEKMAMLNASSVNSLRMYSLLDRDGNVKVYSSVVRMGVGDSKLDNFSAGGITCGVREDGTLRKFGYNHTESKVEVHPTSGVRFEGFEIPSFQKAKELIQKAHPMIAHFRSIAWDIAIDRNGVPVLIEVNLSRGGIVSLQLNNGPLYGEDTKKVLDEVFGKA